jgi:hypothetical protein
MQPMPLMLNPYNKGIIIIIIIIIIINPNTPRNVEANVPEINNTPQSNKTIARDYFIQYDP